MNRAEYRGVLASLLVSLLLGCASAPQYYPNTLEKNLTVNLNLADKGGFLTTVSAYAGVNDMTGDCTSQYQGFVDLTDGVNKIGLAPGKTKFVVVQISHRSRSNSSSFQRGTMITPAAGKQYEIAVNFADGMFDFRLYDVTKAGKKELPIVPDSACKPSK